MTGKNFKYLFPINILGACPKIIYFLIPIFCCIVRFILVTSKTVLYAMYNTDNT